MRPDERMGPKFLLYHDIVGAAGGDERSAAEGFRRQLDIMAESGHRFARMSDFVDGAELGPRDVVITVDDGARSFITCMIPALLDHGASATLFIVTGFMGRTGDGVEFVSWEDVDALQGQGMEIGCHGVSHVPLDQVSPGVMRADIAESTAELKERGVGASVFAYPFGRYDEATKRAVEEAGYAAAFTVMKGGFDRFEIRRRLLTGTEGPAMTRFVLSDRFFGVREGVRRLVPRRLLKQEAPIAPDRWGGQHFGIEE
ncbi:MAG: polysaccharide deacetylase family protein [Coriobacteriales bacterium]|nr:polysaccharide deacetylase family protein [Coriobacteriales bacterium]